MKGMAAIFKSRLFSLKRIYVELIIVLMLGFMFAAGCSTGPGEPGAEIGDSAPDFTLVDLDGNQVSLGDFRGKAVFLNFWASW
jgi:cytochrome oxidase Cu insertion factor (SCO1/SenC/PrrC family)